MSESLSILLMTRATPLHLPSGGMERHTMLLAEGLVARGHRLRLLTTRRPPGRGEDESAPGLRVEYLDRTRPGSYRGGYWRQAAQRARRLVDEGDVDLVISQSAAAFGLLASRRPRPPLVLVLHGTTLAQLARARGFRRGFAARLDALLKRGWHHLANRRLIPRAEAVAAVSPPVAERAPGEFGLRPERVSLIPNGVDCDRFRPPDEARPSDRLLYVGRVADEKGVDLLFTLMTSLSKDHPHLSLDCHGDGPALARCRQETQARGLEERLRFHGSLAHDALPARLGEATLLVHPSRTSEGQPLVLLEAMASGLPVVATSVGGVPDLLGKGRYGELVPPDDPVALTRAVAQLLSDSARRAELGRAAREHVERDYSSARMVERYEALALRLVEEAS